MTSFSSLSPFPSIFTLALSPTIKNNSRWTHQAFSMSRYEQLSPIPFIRKDRSSADQSTPQDKVVLVTGGAKGIGRMISEGFVANGAKVYISSRDAKACEQACKELNALGMFHPASPGLFSWCTP